MASKSHKKQYSCSEVNEITEKMTMKLYYSFIVIFPVISLTSEQLYCFLWGFDATSVYTWKILRNENFQAQKKSWKKKNPPRSDPCLNMLRGFWWFLGKARYIDAIFSIFCGFVMLQTKILRKTSTLFLKDAKKFNKKACFSRKQCR